MQYLGVKLFLMLTCSSLALFLYSKYNITVWLHTRHYLSFTDKYILPDEEWKLLNILMFIFLF